MNFEWSADQAAFIAAVQALAARHANDGQVNGQRLHRSARLDHDLDATGFFDAMAIDDIGRLGAVAMIIELAGLPQVCELVAAALVAPVACPRWPRPCAVLWNLLDAPARFLPAARTVIAVRGDAVQAAAIGDADVVAVDSLFAYPMGRLRDPASLRWERLDADPAAVRDLWCVGVAAEIVGTLDAGLKSVIAHVKERRQFGRPLGAFQAVQHRLADDATLIEGARWLTLKAADTMDAVDVLIAIAQAQHIVDKMTFDLHQFMGAMGLTLEHPLHRWTYRARLLRSELGGAEHHFAAAAQAAWSAS